MFRKDPRAREEWSLENVSACAVRQLDILGHAATMLRPGGRLVYSTCTFSPEENEGVISRFLEKDSRLEIEDVHVYEGFDHVRKEWVFDAATDIEKTIRIWPQQVRGEGHYIAVLRKAYSEETSKWKYAENVKDQRQLKDFFQFANEGQINTFTK